MLRLLIRFRLPAAWVLSSEGVGLGIQKLGRSTVSAAFVAQTVSHALPWASVLVEGTAEMSLDVDNVLLNLMLSRYCVHEISGGSKDSARQVTAVTRHVRDWERLATRAE